MENIKIWPPEKINKSTNTTLKKRKDDLTIEELRNFPGFENMSEEELNQRVESLKEFSLLLYKAFTDQQ